MNERKRRPEDEFMAGAVEYWENRTGRKRDDYPKESLDDEGRRKRLERIWKAQGRAGARKVETWSRSDLEAASGRCRDPEGRNDARDVPGRGVAPSWNSSSKRFAETCRSS